MLLSLKWLFIAVLFFSAPYLLAQVELNKQLEIEPSEFEQEPSEIGTLADWLGMSAAARQADRIIEQSLSQVDASINES
ncbi:MAG: hypothetical protein V3T17_18970 [Pseudomonadales bacterium]